MPSDEPPQRPRRAPVTRTVTDPSEVSVDRGPDPSAGAAGAEGAWHGGKPALPPLSMAKGPRPEVIAQAAGFATLVSDEPAKKAHDEPEPPAEPLGLAELLPPEPEPMSRVWLVAGAAVVAVGALGVALVGAWWLLG